MVPDATGPVHAYMHASPGCWALYCGLEDWKTSLAVGHDAPTLIQHLVDSYAVQHAANPGRRNRQSVAVHLMSLCTSLEQGIPGARLRHDDSHRPRHGHALNPLPIRAHPHKPAKAVPDICRAHAKTDNPSLDRENNSFQDHYPEGNAHTAFRQHGIETNLRRNVLLGLLRVAGTLFGFPPAQGAIHGQA
jgi:hypothetical protein